MKNPFRKRWEAGAVSKDDGEEFYVVRTWLKFTAEQRYELHCSASRLFRHDREPFLRRLP